MQLFPPPQYSQLNHADTLHYIFACTVFKTVLLLVTLACSGFAQDFSPPCPSF